MNKYSGLHNAELYIFRVCNKGSLKPLACLVSLFDVYFSLMAARGAATHNAFRRAT